jgi:hypothetical protein
MVGPDRERVGGGDIESAAASACHEEGTASGEVRGAEVQAVISSHAREILGRERVIEASNRGLEHSGLDDFM